MRTLRCARGIEWESHQPTGRNLLYSLLLFPRRSLRWHWRGGCGGWCFYPFIPCHCEERSDVAIRFFCWRFGCSSVFGRPRRAAPTGLTWRNSKSGGSERGRSPAPTELPEVSAGADVGIGPYERGRGGGSPPGIPAPSVGLSDIGGGVWLPRPTKSVWGCEHQKCIPAIPQSQPKAVTAPFAQGSLWGFAACGRQGRGVGHPPGGGIGTCPFFGIRVE